MMAVSYKWNVNRKVIRKQYDGWYLSTPHLIEYWYWLYASSSKIAICFFLFLNCVHLFFSIRCMFFANKLFTSFFSHCIKWVTFIFVIWSISSLIEFSVSISSWSLQTTSSYNSHVLLPFSFLRILKPWSNSNNYPSILNKLGWLYENSVTIFFV